MTLRADALRCLHKAVGYYTDLGRLGMAARNLRVSIDDVICMTAFWQIYLVQSCFGEQMQVSQGIVDKGKNAST